MTSSWLDDPITGFLLDISGVLKNGDNPIDGSIEALTTLNTVGTPYRLLTNETQMSKRLIFEHLVGMGFPIPSAHFILSPAPALAMHLVQNRLRPRLLVHEKLLEDFVTVDQNDPNCLVFGDAVNGFNYENMNSAFRFLMDDPSRIFFSMGKGKYYMENGQLTLDLGAFTHGLEYATGRTSSLFGKPSSVYFSAALQALGGLQPHEVVMIGDDIVGDIGGAQEAGIRGILVKTGKYREGDEIRQEICPTGVVENLNEAISQYFRCARSN